MDDDRPSSPVGQEFTFLFDGEGVPARPGQSVAAALIAAGKFAWRIDEAGHFKGMLCGIGLCFECRCRIDGIPDRRACMTEARPDMRVECQRGLA